MIIHEAIESLFKNQLEIHCNPKEFIGQLTRTTITVFEPTRTPGKSWGVPLWYMFLDGRRTKRSPTTWNAYDYICICFNNRQYMWRVELDNWCRAEYHEIADRIWTILYVNKTVHFADQSAKPPDMCYIWYIRLNMCGSEPNWGISRKHDMFLVEYSQGEAINWSHCWDLWISRVTVGYQDCSWCREAHLQSRTEYRKWPWTKYEYFRWFGRSRNADAYHDWANNNYTAAQNA